MKVVSSNPIKEEAQKEFQQLVCKMLLAFMECSSEIQEVIRDMAEIIRNPESDSDDIQMANDTIIEALFPECTDDGIGCDLEAFLSYFDQEYPELTKEMDDEEASFATNVKSIMAQKGMNQEQLAAAIGVKQPAVSMMLSRQSRPQMKTVAKIAQALNVEVRAIWKD